MLFKTISELIKRRSAKMYEMGDICGPVDLQMGLACLLGVKCVNECGRGGQ